MIDCNLKGIRVILASASPRRAQLLKLIGLDFEIIPSEIQENHELFAIPEVHVLEWSQKKAMNVAEKVDEGLIIGADTIVVLNNKILGKPGNENEAKQMLRELSGQTHIVYTGFALIHKPSGEIINDYDKTFVTFRTLQDSEIEAYVKTGHPMDKAGAYGIQDESAVFAEKIEGCFYNVVGFPLTKFYLSLKKFLQALNV